MRNGPRFGWSLGGVYTSKKRPDTSSLRICGANLSAHRNFFALDNIVNLIAIDDRGGKLTTGEDDR